MKRCITCHWWTLAHTGMGLCKVDGKHYEPGCTCIAFVDWEGGGSNRDWQRYLIALIGREYAIVGELDHIGFCDEITELYKQLSPPVQINTHDAVRLFLTNSNVE